MDLNRLQVLIEQSAQLVYEHDAELIKLTGNEQSIVFRFGLYLNQLLEQEKLFKDDLSLDAEYNKYENTPKRLGEKLIRPDLILHKRSNQECNLIAIECKKDKPNDSHDLRKLKQLTLDPDYQYQLGCFINFTNHAPEFTYFVDGEINKSLAKVIV